MVREIFPYRSRGESKGKEIYDVTDFDGLFTLNGVNVGDVIDVTYLGYNPQSFTITDQNKYNIILTENQSQLDQVVVVGYGTQKKRDLTGAITTINAEEMRKHLLPMLCNPYRVR